MPLREMYTTCVDPEGMYGPRSLLENHKVIGFLRHTGPDPLNIHRASIKCWTTIGPLSVMARFQCYLDPLSSPM